MSEPNYQLEVYSAICNLVVNNPDFKTFSGGEVGANNQIRFDSNKLNPNKTTAGQAGDLPELLFRPTAMRDNASRESDETRPTFGVVEGEDCDDAITLELEYVITLTYPDKRLEEFSPLLDVIRQSLSGYELRNTAGLKYAGDVSVVSEFEEEAEWHGLKKPQDRIIVTVPVMQA